jgi:hypothetical protein
LCTTSSIREVENVEGRNSLPCAKESTKRDRAKNIATGFLFIFHSKMFFLFKSLISSACMPKFRTYFVGIHQAHPHAWIAQSKQNPNWSTISHN